MNPFFTSGKQVEVALQNPRTFRYLGASWPPRFRFRNPRPYYQKSVEYKKLPNHHPWTWRYPGTEWRPSLWFRYPATANYPDYGDHQDYTDYQDYEADHYPTDQAENSYSDPDADASDEAEEIEEILERLHLNNIIPKRRERKSTHFLRLKKRYTPSFFKALGARMRG